jgi:hypothetical protein
MRLLSSVLAFVVVGSANAFPAHAVIHSETSPSQAAAAVSYADMSEAQRLAYVSARAERIARMLALEGERPVAISTDGAQAIKQRLDRYVARAASKSNVPGNESLATVYERAAKAAPTVSRAFKNAGLPSAYGLYIAFIESEYADCLSSKLGSRGVFQFLPATGAKYGLGPDDFCNLEKSADAAARYIVDRRGEFVGDDVQSLLVLLSYNSGSKYIDAELRPAIDAAGGDRAAAFWSMTAEPSRYPLAKYFQEEGKGYVPSFFAAAILGENPHDFGLGATPLSAVGSR